MMFVFDMASRKEAAARKKTKLADIKPDKSVAGRIEGEKMSNVRVHKIHTIALTSAIALASIVPWRNAMGQANKSMDLAYSKPSGLMTALPEISIKPAIGKDTADISMNARQFVWKAGDALGELELKRFPSDVKEITLNDGKQALFVMTEGIIYVRQFEIVGNEVKVHRMIFKPADPIQENGASIDANGIYARLNVGPKGTQLFAIDEANKKAVVIQIADEPENVKPGSFRMEINIDDPKSAKVEIYRTDTPKEQKMHSVEMNTGAITDYAER